MKQWATQKSGFTIVELLIVVVVIAILAAITIVAYNGIQNRAYDSAVQADLKNIGTKTLQYIQTNDTIPTSAVLVSLGAGATDNAYGYHYTPTGSSGYNLLQCVASAQRFIYVATSKSGNTFVFSDGKVSPGVGPLKTHTSSCPENGLPTTGNWMFNNGTWQI